MPIFIIGIGILAFLFTQNAKASVENLGESKVNKRLFGLPDIEPTEQGGTFKTDYDMAFESVADSTQVPFALLKAHAIMESSLNPRAFRDENPNERDDRQGWASRGLMQILWWPGSNRFKKYGYNDDDMEDGEAMFDPHVNIDIAAQLIAENLKACSGNVRDAINMYNTGKKEAQYEAPYNYVDKVMKNYSTLIGKEVLS